ncbi:dienelactone hydrolase [Parvibaculum indicum]|uniref:dienelactone hydrolase family protein n=1 Tax=Parvibaculum indicum TaxID=562969 RepID=UPI00141DC09A|nr:dienelactone hydrolase family protein [Parvibaculum indicum]NIJ41033.1 dienelactone hydrolase [Parvibaculum indicum]
MTSSDMQMATSLQYVTFPSLHETPLDIAARMSTPTVGGKKPAVIILHGSAGPSMRETGYADVLNAAGIVTLEPDLWSARGIGGGSEGRPKTVVETLPDVYGARAFLAAHPEVDGTRIGVMGFSFGGVASMLVATHAQNDRFLKDAHFKAMMPVYPVASAYNRVPGFEFGDLVDAPVMMVTGELDEYDDDPEAGPKLVASLDPADAAKVKVHVMKGAHHCFDMPGANVVVTDPVSHRGAGGEVHMLFNDEAMETAHKLAVDFFSDAL